MPGYGSWMVRRMKDKLVNGVFFGFIALVACWIIDSVIRV